MLAFMLIFGQQPVSKRIFLHVVQSLLAVDDQIASVIILLFYIQGGDCGAVVRAIILQQELEVQFHHCRVPGSDILVYESDYWTL